MTIEQLHWEVLNRFDGESSLTRRGLLPHELDAVLNDAILTWFYRTYNVERKSAKAFEVTQSFTDKLAPLVVKSPSGIESGLTKEATSYTHTGGIIMDEFKLSGTAKTYVHLINASVKLVDCTLPVELRFIDHDDISKALVNEYEKPNDKWMRVIATIGAASDDDDTSSIFVYRTENQNIELLYPEYLRLPAEVTIGAYNDANNQVKTKTECDIPSQYHNEIVDIAVTQLKRTLSPDTVAVYEDKVIK